MSRAEPPFRLVDANLLVLYVVGKVNPSRISTFKRTSKFTRGDYDLLLRVMAAARSLVSSAHVLAEVSNLADMDGRERAQAREILRNTIEALTEVALPSVNAAHDKIYQRLGLTDAAIAVIAEREECVVLTDDLDLYVALSGRGVPVYNFTHLQAEAWRL